MKYYSKDFIKVTLKAQGFETVSAYACFTESERRQANR